VIVVDGHVSQVHRVHSIRVRPLCAALVRPLSGALAMLIALQAFAAGIFTTLGPLHTHRAPAALVVLDDLRRGPPRIAAVDDAGHRHGHSHAGGVALRHHHAHGDPSTVFVGDAALQPDDADAGLAGATLAACIAVVPSAPAWAPPGVSQPRPSASAWVPQARPPDPFERPPRRA
jgi:hypothetical protein